MQVIKHTNTNTLFIILVNLFITKKRFTQLFYTVRNKYLGNTIVKKYSNNRFNI